MAETNIKEFSVFCQVSNFKTLLTKTKINGKKVKGKARIDVYGIEWVTECGSAFTGI